MTASSLLLAALLTADAPLGPGDHMRRLEVDGQARSYLIHVPPQYDARKPAPVVLVFHGAAMNGPLMSVFCGMNQKADQAGFIAVYPSGTGIAGILLTWNAGGWANGGRVDDVAFVRKLLDDLAGRLTVDPRRVYATGLSNGGMMCYRLAAELSDRIAAIAPVAGTIAIEKCAPQRPVSVLHFHGTADTLVPFGGPGNSAAKFITFKSVEESIRTWVKINGCAQKPQITDLPDKADDGITVQQKTYSGGRDGTEVVLIVITGGGHTWPGQDPPVGFIGKSTHDISANDLIWEFFQRHPLPATR